MTIEATCSFLKKETMTPEYTPEEQYLIDRYSAPIRADLTDRQWADIQLLQDAACNLALLISRIYKDGDQNLKFDALMGVSNVFEAAKKIFYIPENYK